jgi:hypothetical protein
MLEKVLVALVAPPFLLGAAVAPVDHAQVVFSFSDADIIESSGLAVVGGLVITTNDSGDTGRVFAVDPADGRTVSTIGWEDHPTDVEAIAPDGRGGVWVGDIGDNTESRDRIQVADVPIGASDTTLTDLEVFDLAYPDGPHNAETLMTDPVTGRLYVATKGAFGGTLYAVPASLSPDRTNQLEPLGDVLPIATDGAFLADGRHFVVRNYGAAAVYAFPSLQKVAEFRLPDQPQGEGLAVEPDGSLLLSSEGVHSDVLRVRLPALADAPVSSPTATTTPSATPSATSSATAQAEADAASQPPGTDDSERPVWPWVLGGVVGLGCVVVLVRSLRPR